ncbi:hypothetical protein F4780DRAFT_348644 [Xylariomycetidae sp. FL0641]|nr:hypothetical protein F4780DRAFT_348644 [Xylariomycetidae sp. FL0641]
MRRTSSPSPTQPRTLLTLTLTLLLLLSHSLLPLAATTTTVTIPPEHPLHRGHLHLGRRPPQQHQHARRPCRNMERVPLTAYADQYLSTTTTTSTPCRLAPSDENLAGRLRGRVGRRGEEVSLRGPGVRRGGHGTFYPAGRGPRMSGAAVRGAGRSGTWSVSTYRPGGHVRGEFGDMYGAGAAGALRVKVGVLVVLGAWAWAVLGMG